LAVNGSITFLTSCIRCLMSVSTCPLLMTIVCGANFTSSLS
jgi:hypothetical protein